MPVVYTIVSVQHGCGHAWPCHVCSIYSRRWLPSAAGSSMTFFSFHTVLEDPMHEFRGIGIMPCATFNHTIPVVHLTQFQKLSIENFWGTVVLNNLQQCQVLQYKEAAQAIERCLAERGSYRFASSSSAEAAADA
jgi:hypothetical protein